MEKEIFWEIWRDLRNKILVWRIKKKFYGKRRNFISFLKRQRWKLEYFKKINWRKWENCWRVICWNRNALKRIKRK
jgi:hypothetical protein